MLYSRSTTTTPVWWRDPVAQDYFGKAVRVTSNHEPGSRFNYGTTEVVYIAVDDRGINTTCRFTVTVRSQGKYRFTVQSRGKYRFTIQSRGKYRFTVQSRGKYSFTVQSRGKYRFTIQSQGQVQPKCAKSSTVKYTKSVASYNIKMN